MLELELVAVRVDVPLNQPYMLLRERSGDRFLAVWIGPQEAAAIALAVDGIRPPRPLTHDLFTDVLDEVGAELEEVRITALVDGTYLAELQLTVGIETHVVSARPSDAVALAVRSAGAVPIRCDPGVLDEAALDRSQLADAGLEPDGWDEADEGGDPEEDVRRFRQFLEDVAPEDFMNA
jgi:uncharacterized protein